MLLRFVLFSSIFIFLIETVICEPKNLGISLPLSGDAAGWGADVRNSLIFAQEKLGDDSIKFVFEDDRCDPKEAVMVANKLTAIDKVKEVFVMCGQSVLAAAPIYKRAGTTVITMGTPSKISDFGVFRMSMSDAVGAKLLARHIKKHQRSVTVITEETSYPTEFWEDFNLAAKSIRLRANNEFAQAQQHDFRSLLIRIKKTNPEALFLNLQSESGLTALIKQLKELEMLQQLYGAYIPGSASFLKLIGKLADGLKFIDFPSANDLLNSKGQKFYTEYQSRFGITSGWSFTFPGVYEVYRLVHDSDKLAIPLREYLRLEKFNGIFGLYSFDNHGDLVGPKQVMRIIKNGQNTALIDP
jgi:branched-chain amino acid transport system substrate-binding protein